MIKNIATLMVIYVFILALAAQLYLNNEYAISIVLGGSLMLINLAGLAIAWRLIFFAKKSIALAAFVIIFKYVILGMILWSLASVSWLKLTGFLLGMTSMVFAILVATLVKSYSRKTRT